MTAVSIGRPRFLTVDEALAQHAIAIHQFGGSDGLRDRAALESAIAMPQQSFGGEHAHAFPFGMAAAYAFHIAKNHPFVDGNKRVALLCCTVFLRLNGWNLTAEGTDAADAVLALIDGAMDKAGFAQWLKEHCRQRPSMELRDFVDNIDANKLLSTILSIRRSPAPEARATHHDAATSSFPIVSELIRIALERDDNEAAQFVCICETFFVALHRIAEDMGYEW